MTKLTTTSALVHAFDSAHAGKERLRVTHVDRSMARRVLQTELPYDNRGNEQGVAHKGKGADRESGYLSPVAISVSSA